MNISNLGRYTDMNRTNFIKVNNNGEYVNVTSAIIKEALLIKLNQNPLLANYETTFTHADTNTLQPNNHTLRLLRLSEIESKGGKMIIRHCCIYGTINVWSANIIRINTIPVYYVYCNKCNTVIYYCEVD